MCFHGSKFCGKWKVRWNRQPNLLCRDKREKKGGDEIGGKRASGTPKTVRTRRISATRTGTTITTTGTSPNTTTTTRTTKSKMRSPKSERRSGAAAGGGGGSQQPSFSPMSARQPSDGCSLAANDRPPSSELLLISSMGTATATGTTTTTTPPAATTLKPARIGTKGAGGGGAGTGVHRGGGGESKKKAFENEDDSLKCDLPHGSVQTIRLPRWNAPRPLDEQSSRFAWKKKKNNYPEISGNKFDFAPPQQQSTILAPPPKPQSSPFTPSQLLLAPPPPPPPPPPILPLPQQQQQQQVKSSAAPSISSISSSGRIKKKSKIASIIIGNKDGATRIGSPISISPTAAAERSLCELKNRIDAQESGNLLQPLFRSPAATAATTAGATKSTINLERLKKSYIDNQPVNPMMKTMIESIMLISSDRNNVVAKVVETNLMKSKIEKTSSSRSSSSKNHHQEEAKSKISELADAHAHQRSDLRKASSDAAISIILFDKNSTNNNHQNNNQNNNQHNQINDYKSNLIIEKNNDNDNNNNKNNNNIAIGSVPSDFDFATIILDQHTGGSGKSNNMAAKSILASNGHQKEGGEQQGFSSKIATSSPLSTTVSSSPDAVPNLAHSADHVDFSLLFSDKTAK